MLTDEDLIEVVEDLILTNREGDCWDFKEKPHDNKAGLLHDILCLANCKSKHNRYLVIGVTDPANGAKVVGLDGTNRRDQNSYINFLRDKKFVGEVKPEIELRAVAIEGKEVDILIIFNRTNKPYYLTEDFSDKGKTVKANYIYTRVGDTNTPINESADINKIEFMWRERFGLDLLPLEKMEMLLEDPDGWFKDLGNKYYCYYKQFPEYKIELSQHEPFTEIYSFFYPNLSSSVGTAYFKYHSTILFELEYVWLDEFRTILPSPNPRHLDLNGVSSHYYYYNLSSKKGKFLKFLDKYLKFDSWQRGRPLFLTFDDDRSMFLFERYIKDNVEVFNNLESGQSEKVKEDMIKKDFYIDVQPDFSDKVFQMYEKWKLVTTP